MVETGVRTRFAPTPSGYLHVGNAFSFVLAWLYARSSPNGYIHLRIDDIDGERAKQEYVEDIFSGLEWLGLDWDGGPQTVDDFFKSHSQHHREKVYNTYLNELKHAGHLFACTCSRKRVQNLPRGLYDGHCQNLNLPFDAPETAWRMVTPEGQSSIGFTDVWNTYAPINLRTEMPYFIVRGKNGRAAYQLASLADDAAYNINFIVRGEDLLQSTAAQCFLADKIPALQSFTQTRFLHHPLILDDKGEKLAKSRGSTALVDMLQSGQKVEEVYLLISSSLKLPPATSATELLGVFGTSPLYHTEV